MTKFNGMKLISIQCYGLKFDFFLALCFPFQFFRFSLSSFIISCISFLCNGVSIHFLSHFLIPVSNPYNIFYIHPPTNPPTHYHTFLIRLLITLKTLNIFNTNFQIYSQLLRCCTARGSSTGFSRVSHTKVEACKS